jgi:hypothetical protein
VKAVVSYEPGFVFPDEGVPPPIPLFKGTMAAGAKVPPADFANLVKVPLQVVYGDNQSRPVRSPIGTTICG